MRVVELAQWVFVPVAGALLADWGADVIHIESTQGDPYRGLVTQGIGSDRGGVNLSLALANRGKRSVALNIKLDEGMEALHRLLSSADVFLTNMRPKALQRLGLDAESLTDRYPTLIYARGHGYGVRGPDADQAGYDASAFWSRGGLAHMLTPPERDYPIGQRGAMGDRNGAMALAFGVAGGSAQAGPHRDGIGGRRFIRWPRPCGRCPPMCSPPSVVTNRRRRAVEEFRINPVVGMYRTKDGRHIQLVFLEADRYWPDFCRVIGRPDLIDDSRFCHHANPGPERRGLCSRARWRVRQAHLYRVEGTARPVGRALGAGAVGPGVARRPPSGGQRLHRRRGGRRRIGSTAYLPYPYSSTESLLHSDEPRSTARTLRPCWSNWATTGTRSSGSRRLRSSFDHAQTAPPDT